jgi:hypothetical protein
VQTIAALSIVMVEMHLKFSILRKIKDETVNKFVSQLSVANKTSNNEYTFYLESYILDVQGKFLSVLLLLRSLQP